MLYNYFRYALRHMTKQRAYSFINISGLGIGIAICLLLSMWVRDELSYDRFHDNSNRIYRTMWEARFGDNSWKIPQVPMPLASTLESEFPEVEMASQVYEGRFTAQRGNEYIRENNVLFVDEDFFDVFSVKLIAGQAKSAISNPDIVILTRETAERYFGQIQNLQDIIGRTIPTNQDKSFLVAGVVESFPEQSHLSFDFLASINQLTQLEQRKNHWGSATLLTYFLLNEGGNPEELDKKLQAFVDENLMDDSFRQSGNYTKFPFEPIADIHLKPNLTYIWLFALIAAFILILACINFINLTTARIMNRVKEVGIRKVLGSSKWQLIHQYFAESTLFVTLALVLAIMLAQVGLPYLNHITGKELALDFTGSPFLWYMLGGIFLLTSLTTGTIPALTLASFAPVKVIQGEIVKLKGKDRFRQGLVIFQFAISSIIIMGTLMVNNQLNYLQERELGFDKEQVLILRRANSLQSGYSAFLDAVRQHPSILKASTTQFMPGDNFDSTIFLPEQPSNYERTSLSYCHIDEEFAGALNLRIIKGRDYDLSLTTDSTAYLINETAAKRLGWDDPVGKNLSYGGMTDGRIIGVVEDFNFTSLHEPIEPLVLRMAKFNLPNIFLRLQPGNLGERLEEVESVWKSIAPEAPFEFAFLDEEIQRLYDNEQRMSSIMLGFAILAIFIACLGLFGLSSYMAEQRTREVGIRKVLGASVPGILALLSKDFLKLVVIALVVASPLSYYLLQKWLENFAYHSDIKIQIFLITGSLTILILLITVLFQSLKAALTNPVESLRNE